MNLWFHKHFKGFGRDVIVLLKHWLLCSRVCCFCLMRLDGHWLSFCYCERFLPKLDVHLLRDPLKVYGYWILRCLQFYHWRSPRPDIFMFQYQTNYDFHWFFIQIRLFWVIYQSNGVSDYFHHLFAVKANITIVFCYSRSRIFMMTLQQHHEFCS